MKEQASGASYHIQSQFDIIGHVMKMFELRQISVLEGSARQLQL